MLIGCHSFFDQNPAAKAALEAARAKVQARQAEFEKSQKQNKETRNNEAASSSRTPSPSGR